MEYAAFDDERTLSAICPTPWDKKSHPMGQVVPPPGTNAKRHEKMKRLVVRQKELHTLKYRLHTLNEMIDYQKDNCSVYAVYADSKKLFHDTSLFLFQRKHNFLAFYLQSSKILAIFAPCKIEKCYGDYCIKSYPDALVEALCLQQ